MSKSILTPLTVAEFRENAGNKVKKMGAGRKDKLRKILANAMARHATIKNTATTLKRLAASTRDKKRDWVRVVQTEYTDAKGIASFDLLQSLFGDDHSIYRESDPDCCKICKDTFGIVPRYKKFRLASVPLWMRGAIHPNCICGPWRSVETPDLTKAMDSLADIPIGIVKRVKEGIGWRAEVSTGTGYWVSLESATGKSIMRVVLMHTPAILVGKSKGFTIMAHGRHPMKGSYSLYDIMKLGAARFYPYNIVSMQDNEMREKGMSIVCDLPQYLDKVRAAIPTVATMPEYWETGAQWRYLTDFMGYKTLTDYFIVLPGEPPLGSLISRLSSGVISQTKAIRNYVQKAIEQASLKKAKAETLPIKSGLKMIESGRGEKFDTKKRQYILNLMKDIAPHGWKLTTVKVDDVNRRDPKKWRVDAKKIKKYVKVDPEKMPPILLTKKGYGKKNYFGDMLPGSSKSKHTVIDGNHRHEAAVDLGLKTMKAWVPI